MLRGERDQNAYIGAAAPAVGLPECSGGSEIKTIRRLAGRLTSGYQNAPGGARSKLDDEVWNGERHVTRMLRGERDQNSPDPQAPPATRLPECSGGSEIKTRAIQRAPLPTSYQNAPGGARSKLLRTIDRSQSPVTRMLRGERDQNNRAHAGRGPVRLPECSGGSEIKTRFGQRQSLKCCYQNAPGGARSKQTMFRWWLT